MNCAPTLMAQASNRANSVGLTNICGSTTSWPFARYASIIASAAGRMSAPASPKLPSHPPRGPI